jgi:repressor LexA
MLNEKEKRLLYFIFKEINERGYPPSIREMMRVINVTSLRGVTYHLEELQRKGYIQRERTSRSIKLLQRSFFEMKINHTTREGDTVSVPFVGSIAAGNPVFAFEDCSETISIPRSIASNNENIFALRVEGDSMIGDHILDGDVIIIKRQNYAINGDIVVAIINDEATLKRYYQENNYFKLQPSNPKYSPIIIKENLNINGVMIGLMRVLKN